MRPTIAPAQSVDELRRNTQFVVDQIAREVTKLLRGESVEVVVPMKDDVKNPQERSLAWNRTTQKLCVYLGDGWVDQ